MGYERRIMWSLMLKCKATVGKTVAMETRMKWGWGGCEVEGWDRIEGVKWWLRVWG